MYEYVCYVYVYILGEIVCFVVQPHGPAGKVYGAICTFPNQKLLPHNNNKTIKKDNVNIHNT